MEKKFHARCYSKPTKTAIMILLFALVITLTKAIPDKISPSQVLIAASILKKMDLNANPCDDFYQFACGKFLEEAIIPDGSSATGTFEDIDAKVEYQLSRIIPDGITEDSPPVFKSMKNYYRACMDTDEIEKNSEKNLREVLKKLGGCPLLEDQSWDEKNFDWTTSTYKSNKIGYSNDFFIRVSVAVDPDNSSRAIINIDQPNFAIPQENLNVGKSNRIVSNHLQALIKIFEFLGVDKKVAEKELDSVVDLEIDLAKISLSRNQRKNKTQLNNRMTLQQLETNYTGIAWTKFLNEILSPYAQIDQNEEIMVAVPNFVKSLPELIAKTPKRVLANYVCVRTIWESIDNMGDQFLSTKIEDVKAYKPQIKSNKPRWRYCLNKVTQYFSTAVGWLYVKNYFDRDAKDNAVQMVEMMRETLVHYLFSAGWLHDHKKDNVTSKLSAIVAHIGYPDEFENAEKLNEAYQNLTVHSQNFFDSELALKQFDRKELYSSLRKPVNKTSWMEHGDVAQVNAYYTLQYNSLDLPAGILQGEFFSKDRPKYMNYAAIGSFVGHEITHAFDNRGNQYDKDGNLKDLFGEITRAKFSERTECIIQQYSNYTVKQVNMKIDGTRTLNENFADNIGLEAAYRAYHLDTLGTTEASLPGLYYTPQQMFWITFANAWCAKYESEYLKMGLKYSEHTPSEFRVIGTLSNMPEFSEDFNCPIGSRMNPEKKCPLD